MTRRNFVTAATLLALVFCTTGVSECGTAGGAGGNEQTNSKPQPPTPTPTPSPVAEGTVETNGAIKELAAGGYSSINEPFVIVARDAETYALLRQLNEALPAFDADYFKSNAVVAAFLGGRRSGGYRVEITRTRVGGLRIAEAAPPKGAITTMALTAPFRVVSVAAHDERPLALELDAAWQQAARPYKITAGDFTRMGGFAGRAERSTLAGELRVMRRERLATIFFTLTGAGEGGARGLQDVATGAVTPEGQITLARLDAGSFVPPPRHPLRATGKFTDDESKLSLSFEAMKLKVADGYGGKGTLEATATAPPQKKKAVADEVVM
ncbi:MAG TPA: protease complex subunit PrcB family protein [Pyrinomonadaceae bacterium]|nr:protease complex subunit PrcB family protein [Pyrinomonadaceae bacterium]